MATVTYDIDNLPAVSREDWERIDNLKDEDIDFSDIPVITDFSGFTRHGDQEKHQQKIELTIDKDVGDWLQNVGDVNRVLREVMVLSRLAAKRA